MTSVDRTLRLGDKDLGAVPHRSISMILRMIVSFSILELGPKGPKGPDGRRDESAKSDGARCFAHVNRMVVKLKL